MVGLSGHVQRSLAAMALRIDISTSLEQEFEHGGWVVLSSPVQRSRALLVLRVNVDTSQRFPKDVAILRLGDGVRGLPVAVDRARIGTSVEQELDHVGFFVGHSSPVQRSPAVLVLHIDVGTSLEQDLDHGGRWVGLSGAQRMPIGVVLRIDVSTSSHVQRSPAVVILRIDVGASP